MAKYDESFKLGIVKAYLNGEGSYRELAKEWGMPDSKPLRNWVRIYETVGKAGLQRKRAHQKYSVHFKLDVIHYYQTSRESYLDVAIKYGLSNPAIVKQWHQKFLEKGQEGLSHAKGRPSMSKKPSKQKQETEQTREEELERENELLRAELAFIKKLRASGGNIPSRLLKQKLESSKNSDKPSN